MRTHKGFGRGFLKEGARFFVNRPAEKVIARRVADVELDCRIEFDELAQRRLTEVAGFLRWTLRKDDKREQENECDGVFCFVHFVNTDFRTRTVCALSTWAHSSRAAFRSTVATSRAGTCSCRPFACDTLVESRRSILFVRVLVQSFPRAQKRGYQYRRRPDLSQRNPDLHHAPPVCPEARRLPSG